MQSQADPRRPRPPSDDDALPGVPAIDGAASDTPLDMPIHLDHSDDDASALDDAGSGDLAGALDAIEDGDDSEPTDEDEVAPVDADESLAGGEGERWTEGSDASSDTPWEEPAAVEPTETALDRGDEGFDDLAASGAADALPGLPHARTGDSDDDDADELDVSEASMLDTAIADGDGDIGPPLSTATIATTWRGPSREATRSVAHHDGRLLAAARGLWILGDVPAVGSIGSEGDVSALLTHGDRLWLATDAGEIWIAEAGAAPRRYARPGTDDGSVGGIDLASVGDVVVARTRGGALFRDAGDGWTGPIIAKNVRRMRAALAERPDCLALVVGSAASPELLSTEDGRTFERLRAPVGEVVVDVARSGDAVAVASASGALFVSRDAGASFARAPGAIDVERVWVSRGAVVYAATFHEATDHGRLVRVRGDAVDVILDVEAEVGARRLSGPGDQDGDGRIHALALAAGVLWVATGVGVFSIDVRDETPDE